MSVTREIGNPTRFSHNETRAFAPGLSGGTTGTTLPLPGRVSENGPAFNSHYVRGNSHSDFYDAGVQNTNGRCVYHMSQNVSQWQKGDTLPTVITFGERPRESMLSRKEHSYVLYGLHELNRRLKHELRYRVEYGDQLDGTSVVRDFAYIGVQQSFQLGLTTMGSFNDENNMIIKGRSRMPNIWLAQATARPVKEMDVVFLVLRRRKYGGNDAHARELWDAQPSRHIADHAGAKRKRVESGVHPQIIEPKSLQSDATIKIELGSSIRVPVPKASDAKVIASGLYYWAWEPWTSCDRSAPHPMHYSGDPQGDPNNMYSGDYKHIGQVLHLSRGPNNRTSDQVSRAREALYVNARSEDYIKPLRYIDEVEIHLGFGRC